MLRWIYNLLFPVVFVLLLPTYVRRMVRRGNFLPNFGQRFGWYSSQAKARFANSQGPIWVQAVSVGEMLVALKLIAALRRSAPNLPIVLSTTTTTGYQLATERVGQQVEIIYTPVDLAGAVRRAFDVLRPSQVAIVDGGLWPNQLWEAKRRGVPAALVNARLSPRSESRFRRFPRLASELFQMLSMVCVPEKMDLARWESLGVPKANIHHTGSVKFDDTADPAAELLPTDSLPATLLRKICAANSPVLLAGSTHPGEERLITEVFLKLRQRFNDLFLIVAPRHVERTSNVRAEMEALGLPAILRTELPVSKTSAESLILNTTGELRDWYSVATVVVMGKSFLGIGGQNPVEAITAGKPVILGPHMENFAELTAQLLAAAAAVQVRDAPSLEAACAQLLADPQERQRVATAAAAQIAVHRGAADRTAELLLATARISACQSA